MKFLAIATAFVALSALTAAPACAYPADLVFRNGVIWTVDADNPGAEAVATLGDKIIYVGPDNDVSNFISKDTQVIDLKGLFLIPGFNDNRPYQQTARASSRREYMLGRRVALFDQIARTVDEIGEGVYLLQSR